MTKKIPLVLNENDAEILQEFQVSLSATASDVLRFALRFYALNGPLHPGVKDGLNIVIPPGHKPLLWSADAEEVTR